MKKAARDLLVALACTRDLPEAQMSAERLEREHDFHWRAVGDRENNFGSINMGSDPGVAFVERVTNAIDAVIEREALKRLPKLKGKAPPASPREASQMWLNVPGGRVAGLDIKARQALANGVVIKLLTSAQKRCPTVEVRDYGIGLTPSMMPRTILSIGEGNKIDKPYLSGAYGQGGSTVLAFSPHGALFVSRRQPDLLGGEEDLVAVTFARFNPLDPTKNKNGRFEYLVMPNNEVPALDPSVLPDAVGAPGTAVVHFQLQISQYASRMTQPTGSMWWLMQNSLFDPVMPFWLEEHRLPWIEKDAKPDRRTIAGNYTRLMDVKQELIEHNDSVEVRVVHLGAQANVKVNYWVARHDDENPRAQPIEGFVDPYRPICFTFNGQTHGFEERRFISDRLNLPYLTRYLIVQVDLDHVSAAARRELLSTTRDRLKQLPLFEVMREAISTALSEDENLIRINEARKEKILARHSDAEEKKLRERFARLMERHLAGVDAKVRAKGDAGAGGRPPTTTGTREALAPLVTRDEPTFIKIANTQRPLPITLDRHTLVRLESDAPDGYLMSHVHAKLVLGSDPEGLLILESSSDFKGGRSRATIRVTEKAKEGDAGTLTIFLLTPTGKTLQSKVSFRVELPREQPTAGESSKSKVQAPTPVPIYRNEWAEFAWSETNVSEVREDKTGTKIFVNMDNRHIGRLLQGGGYSESWLTRTKRNYLLYVAFFSWLEHVATKGKDVGMDEAALEAFEAGVLDRVAQTVVHTISAAERHDEED